MNTKKFVAVLLVLAMLLCIPVTASAAETTTIASNISVPGGWQGVCEVYTTNWGGALDPASLTEGGYFTLHLSGENVWSAHLAFNGAAWAQVDRDVSAGTVLDDGSYVFTFSYADCAAAYGGDFSTLGAVYVYVNSPEDGTGVTVHSLTYTSVDAPVDEEPEVPEEPVNNTYVVAGTAGLCGSEWNGTDTANQMTDEDGDGVYTITYYGVAAGYYEFKVVENGENWYGDSNWNNVVLNLGGVCDVTISFDTATYTVSYTISGGEVVDDGTQYIVAGVSELCGSYWDPSDTANLMSDADGDGVYTITYYGVEPGSYEYKVVANLPDGTQNWLCNDGWSNEIVTVEETTDVTICYDKLTGAIYHEGAGVNNDETIASCIVAGYSSLCGSEWDPSDVNNQMLDDDGNGIYTITYYDVAPGYYEFKIVENLSNGTRNWLTNNEYGSNMNVNLTWRTHITITYDSNTGDIAVYKKGKEYTAALGFGDADWWPNTGLDANSAATTIVDGEGNYTLVWDVPGSCWGATAEGVIYFFIDIKGAYAEIAKNTVVTNVTVKADGVEIPVDMSKVQVYDSNGDYRIELTNLTWSGGYTAVDSGLAINETLIVTFTLGSGNATTGDSTNLAVICGAMLVSAMGVVALVVSRKKFI